MGGDAARQVAGRVLLRLVAHHHDLLRPLRDHLVRDRIHPHPAPERLAAGHRHRVVVEDLVGDVDAGRDCGPHREEPAVVVGPVAEVREDVVLVRERRVADPAHPLAAHVGRVHGRALGMEHRHRVAADAGHGARAVGEAGGGVVGAAGAEVGRAAEDRRRSRGLVRDLVDAGEPLDEPAVELGILGAGAARPPKPRRERPRDDAGGELAPLGKERPPRLVPLADDARRGVPPGCRTGGSTGPR